MFAHLSLPLVSTLSVMTVEFIEVNNFALVTVQIETWQSDHCYSVVQCPFQTLRFSLYLWCHFLYLLSFALSCCVY